MPRGYPGAFCEPGMNRPHSTDGQSPVCGHHLVLGKTTDVLTGEELTDTHDEQYRQKIARYFLDEKGYRPTDITPRHPIRAQSGENTALVLVDFVVKCSGKIAMIVKYAAGSLVTRERPALAASRLVEAFQVPVVVVTNGLDAEILKGRTGKITGRGLSGIPGREALMEIAEKYSFPKVSTRQQEMEGRILYTFEAVGTCNCE